MASDGNYILTNDPGTTHTDTAFSYKILTSGTMTGVTYSFNWEFSCNGVTTKKTVATGLTATTYSWTPTTAEFGPLMKKSSSGSLKIIVKTENGRLVQQVREFTLKLNTSIKPTISNMTLVRTNGFNGRSVSNITTHKLSFGVSGLYGAAQTVNVYVGDTTYTKEVAAKSNNAATTVTVDIGTFDTGSSDTLVKNIFITSNDTRGCTGTQYISFTVYKYTAPNVKVSIARNSNEKPVLTFDATYQSTVAGAANTLKTFYARCIVGSTVNDTDSLAHGQLHRNIIKQQCFSGSWKSAEPEISSSFSTYSLQNLPFNISLLGSKEILFFEKTLRFCQRRDQIKLCLKQILDISLIVRAFFPQCNT